MSDMAEDFKAFREVKTERRNARIDQRGPEILALRELGFFVIQHQPWHFKIDKRLSIWPSHNRFHDEKTGRRGFIRGKSIRDFVAAWKEEVTRASA